MPHFVVLRPDGGIDAIGACDAETLPLQPVPAGGRIEAVAAELAQELRHAPRRWLWPAGEAVPRPQAAG